MGLPEGWCQELGTDDPSSWVSLQNRESVRHSRSVYVSGGGHTHGVDSFQSMLRRAHMDTFNGSSEQHLHCYVEEFSGCHNMREPGTHARKCLLSLIGELGRGSGTRIRAGIAK